MKPWDGRAAVNDPIVVGVPTVAPTTILTVTATGDAAGITAVATPNGSIAGTTLIEWAIDGVVVVTTQSLVYRFTTDSAGDALVDGQSYSITAQPTNVVGDGTISAATTGQLNSGVASQTVLGWVAAGFLLAGTIQVGQMTLSPPTADDPGGLRIPLTNGGLIQFPADGSDATITAILRARSLVVENNLRVQGTLNAIEGGLQLANGTTAPTVKPRAGTSWDHAAAFNDTEVSAFVGTPHGLADDGAGHWVTGEIFSGTTVWQIHKTTGVRTLLATAASQFAGYKAHGFAKIGTDWYALCIKGSDSSWWVRKYNSSWVFQSQWQRAVSVTGDAMSLATDGTNLFTAYRNASGFIAVDRHSVTGTGGTNMFTSGTAQTTQAVTGFYVGNADYGAQWYVVSTTNKVWTFNSSGVQGTAQNWTPANGEATCGLAWDGTRFHTLSPTTGRVWHYSTLTTGATRSITHTWYDNDPLPSTTHETEASPALSYAQAPRQYLRVDTDPPSFAGFPDDPNAVRIYVANKRQADLATGATSAIYDPPGTGGSAAPTSNGFAGVSAPGNMSSGASDGSGALIKFDGSGAYRLVGLTDAWTSFGSGTSWTATVSDPVLGNGTWTAQYWQVGKTVKFFIQIAMGSTTTFGSGTWRVPLPVTPLAGVRFAFDGSAFNASADWKVTGRWDSSISRLILGTPATTAGNQDRGVSSAAPFAWGNTHVLYIAGSYPAA